MIQTYISAELNANSNSKGHMHIVHWRDEFLFLLDIFAKTAEKFQ